MVDDVISLPQAHKPPPADGCGPCNVCCDVSGVDALGKPYYARCPHLCDQSTTGGCRVYTDRPGQCAEYRCVWHLGILGPRTDRRPLECGVLFQLEPVASGRWGLGADENRPRALLTEKKMYQIRQLLTGQHTRHLALTADVHLVPYGADVPVLYPIADIYDHTPPPPGIPTTPHGQMKLWSGGVRELLMPRDARER
jgi:hypothetical protein